MQPDVKNNPAAAGTTPIHPAPNTPSPGASLKPAQPPLPDTGPIPFPGAQAALPRPDEAPERLVGPGPGEATRPSWSTPAPDPAAAKASRQLRKVWVLIAGTGVIIFAIVIAPLPGPGFTIFAPIGFAMLASEFMWAKRLANELEHRTGFIEAAAYFVRTRNWWFLPCAAGIYWGLVLWLNHEKVLSAKYLFPLAGGLFAPVGYLAWRTIVHWFRAGREARQRARGDAPGA